MVMMSAERSTWPAWRTRHEHNAASARAMRPEPRFASSGSFPKLEAPDEAAAPSLAGADPAFSATAGEPLAAPAAKRAKRPRRDIAVLAGSCLLHAAVALFFIHLQDGDVEMAGGSQAGVAMIGNAAQDEARPGVTQVTLIPLSRARTVEAAAETIAAEPTPEASEKINAVPVEDSARAAPVAKSSAVAERVVANPAPQPAGTAPAVAPLAPPLLAARAETVPSMTEATPLPSASPAAVPPVEAVAPALLPRAVSSGSEKMAALDPAEDVLPPKVEELPEPRRPANNATEPKAEAARHAARKAEAEKAAKPASAERKKRNGTERRKASAAGSHGAGNADLKRGSADGAAEGRQPAASRGGAAPAAGNAAVSNYPGKIVARLRRALRYPSAAGGRRLRGEAAVQFVVSSGGTVGAVRLVRSSGSPILDEAALDAVRRAAPFPPIPAEAGRSSWPFTVPLAFVR